MDGTCVFLKRMMGPAIEDTFFKLHYKLTLPLLVILSAVVACRQYFSISISCIGKGDLPTIYINNYCYTHSTYSIVESWTKTMGVEIPYPGIDHSQGTSSKSTKKYHAYYPWVATVLLLQAFLFYVPRQVWKVLEKGRIERLLEDVKYWEHTQDLRPVKLKLLVDSVIANRCEKYLGLYAVAEILNVLNVIGQMLLMDCFLGGGFMSYGLQLFNVSDWSQASVSDPMVRLFPKVAQCTLSSYGSSGYIQTRSVSCLLPVNGFNEKIYAFLWFWFVLLAVISCVAVIFRISLALSAHLRYIVFGFCTRDVRRQDLRIVVKGRCAGDWFLLYLLSKNLRAVDFSDVISFLALGASKTDDIKHLED